MPELLSIIIPTLNGGKLFRRVLEKIGSQDVNDYELLIYDSCSDDQTVEYAKSAGAEVISVTRTDFDHGGIRSDAARRAKGNILIFMTQDALPESSNVLSALIKPLLQDNKLAITYGRQLPAEDASPFAAHLRLFNYPETGEQRWLSDREIYGLKTIFVSNSFAAYRKSSLAEVDYFRNGLIFGEDTCAVGRLLLAGYGIEYLTDAAVYHSHNYTLGQEFRRHFDIGVLHTTEKWLMDEFGRAEGQGLRYIVSAMRYLSDNHLYHRFPELFIRAGIKYFGYRLGRAYQHIPGKIVPLLSMQRSWWKKRKL